MSHSLAIAGALAQKPKIPGHTWVLLQYVLGFRRLGWEVLFLDVLDPSLYVDEAGQSCTPDVSVNLRYVRDVVATFRLKEDYVLIGPGARASSAAPRSQILDRVGDSALLLNVMGFLRDEEILSLAPKRVFLDIDPGFGQFWDELGLHHPFAGHDAFVTIGLNIGRPGCTIPTCGLDWIATPQPVVLEWWPRSDARGGSFTTVASWRGAYGPLEYGGKPMACGCTSSANWWTCPGSPAAPSSWPSTSTRPRRRIWPSWPRRDGHWSIPGSSPAIRYRTEVTSGAHSPSSPWRRTCTSGAGADG